MKRLLLVSLFLFSTLSFAQPVIDFETVGNGWGWTVFSQGTGGSFDIVANPAPGGLNTSDSCAMLVISADGDPWAGVFSTDFPDMMIDASNCIVKVLVYKDVTTRFNLKLEPPNVDHFDSNTVINQWEELTFDYSSSIGTTSATLTLIPDQEPPFPRTYASVNYIDYIRFTPQIVPVELTSFTGAFVGNDVELKWATATELNNRGFEIQRSISGSPFVTVAFVEGNGTTTEQRQYSFTDRNVESRINYAYRLKQIDFNGTFEYSSVVNVGFTLPLEFVLEQNYPNPFNPSTSIAYSVPVISNVTLDVYNLIGQKIVTLVEGQVEAGKHTAQLNAVNMSSGIYFFKLTAVGENGSQFSSSKKMTLLK
ncbi:MAG: T9SS type A sorting domain-containing protein [Ignavibacteriota bacterium]